MSLRKLLSIDGGGVRGLGAIVVLEQLMDAANEERRQKDLPSQEPWEMFDMIGGTSTGGLIAVMLGRLHMPLKDCKEAYMNLSRKAFSQRNILRRVVESPGLGPKFDAKPLEEAIRGIIKQAREQKQEDIGNGIEEALLEEENASCKVFVVSHLHGGCDQAAILRSYRNYEKPLELIETMKIWQACSATSAAATFYEPILVGESRYSDGDLLYNNPVQIVHAEASEMFRDEETLLISLGTGIASDKEYSPNVFTIANELAGLATQTQTVADLFIRGDGARAARSKRYFRFDIPGIGDIGLEEADKLHRIKLACEKFLNNPEVGMKIKSCSEQLAEGGVLNHQIKNDIYQSLALYAANPRLDTIRSFHNNSFQWIWNRSNHNFVHWLEYGSGFFWITGKPGSGKSTLMKFLFKHSNTAKYINSKGKDHMICQYFFHELSELDTQQECSLFGLLHAIIFQLLGLFPHLVDLLNEQTPKLLHLEKTSRNLPSPLPIESLKYALMHLGEKKSSCQNICILIDGFDECQGARGTHLDFLKDWIFRMAGCGILIKICLSSRDADDMNGQFIAEQKLELHLWTRTDIRNFVSDALTKAKKKSLSLDSDCYDVLTRKLIDKLVEKAEGVFIWAELVVADLVSDLEVGEDEKVLNTRIDTIPEKIEALYSHIIGQIPCRDLHTAHKYFQLLLRAPGRTCTLTLLQFLMATQNLEYCIRCPVVSLSDSSIQGTIMEKLATLKDHVRSRCRNLLQVQHRKQAQSRWDPARQENITFVHLTFKDYIKKESVKQEINERVARWGMTTIQTADTFLMASCLSLLKTQKCYIPHWAEAKATNSSINQHEQGNDTTTMGKEPEANHNSASDKDKEDEHDEAEYWEEISRRAPDNLITKFFNYASNVEAYFKEAQTKYIDEIDRVLTKADKRWPAKFYFNRTLHHIPEIDVLRLAICWKLKYYVKEMLTKANRETRMHPPLLFFAMNPPGWTHEPVDSELLKILLEANEDPNESYVYNGNEKTTWEHMLQHFLCIGSGHPLRKWDDVLRMMLEYGANINQSVHLRDGRSTTLLHLLIDQHTKVAPSEKKGNKKAILKLLNHKVDWEATDSDNISARAYAQNHCPAILKAMRIPETAATNESNALGNSSMTASRPRRKDSKKTAKANSGSFKRRHSSDATAYQGTSSEQLHRHQAREESPKDHRPLPRRQSKRLRRTENDSASGVR